jgi:hypothetical protein
LPSKVWRIVEMTHCTSLSNELAAPELTLQILVGPIHITRLNLSMTMNFKFQILPNREKFFIL